MNKKISLSLIAGLAVFAPLGVLAQWSAPSQTPPAGNVSAPLNTSGTAQTKTGGLLLNTGNATNGLIVQYGNVGIDTTAPNGPLDVSQDGGIDGLVIRKQQNNTESIQTYIDSQWANRAGYASMYNNVLSLQPDVGVVGIGTLNPAAKLHISAGDSSYALFGPNTSWGGYLLVGSGLSGVVSGKAQVISTNGNLHLDAGTGQYVYIGNYTTTNTFINPNGGNVGINTTGPAYKLDVNGSAAVRAGLITSGAGSGWTSYGATPEIYVNGDNHVGGGIQVSDDGGFYDYNDAWVTFNGSTGLRIGGNNGLTSLGTLAAGTLCLNNSCIASWPSFSDSDTLASVTARGNVTTQDMYQGNYFTMTGTYPTIVMKDTDGKTAYWHNNSNLLYLLSGNNGAGPGGWSTYVNGYWPLVVDLTTNASHFGGAINSYVGDISADAGDVLASGQVRACGGGSCSHLRYGNSANYLRGHTYIGGGAALIDEDSPGYQMDMSGYSNLYLLHAAEVYSNNWLRNQYANTGLYNETTLKHFYSQDASYWAMNSANGMVLRSGYGGTEVGSLYWDGGAGNNNFGLLSPDHSWKVRTYNGGMELSGDVNAPYIRDSNDGSYYVDPNYISMLNDIRPNIIYDRANTGYYLQPSQTSSLRNIAATGWVNVAGNLYVTAGTDFHVFPGVTSYLDGNLWVRGATYGGTGVVYIGDNPSNPNGSLTLYGSGTYQGTWTGASDRRLKTDISAITDPISKIQQLNGVNFKWKSTGQPSVGVIAQDVEKVFPELVLTDEKTGMKSVSYQNLVAPLIEAVKEQQKEIKALQARIDVLEATK